MNGPPFWPRGSAAGRSRQAKLHSELLTNVRAMEHLRIKGLTEQLNDDAVMGEIHEVDRMLREASGTIEPASNSTHSVMRERKRERERAMAAMSNHTNLSAELTSEHFLERASSPQFIKGRFGLFAPVSL